MKNRRHAECRRCGNCSSIAVFLFLRFAVLRFATEHRSTIEATDLLRIDGLSVISVQRQTECAVGKIQFSVFSFQGAVFRVQDLEISSYSYDSIYSWFKIFAFFDKDVIHESNGAFHGLA